MPAVHKPSLITYLPPKNAAVRLLGDLAPLLAGKVPIDRALRLVAEQRRGKRERSAAIELEAALREGRPLSLAMSRNENFYGSAAVAAARAGESSGTIAESLGRYVEHIRRHAQMKRKLGTALAYPATVVLVALVAIGLLLGLVVPRLSTLLDALGGGEAPLPTRILVTLSGIVRGPALIWGTGILLTGALLLFWPHRGRESLFSRSIHRLPVLGAVVQQGALARACATLSALLKSGVPLPEALRLCGPASGNAELSRLISEVSTQVEHGRPMSQTMRRQRWLGLPLVAEAASLGEETGALAEQMDWVSRELESRSAARSAVLLSLLEPALIVLMALVVGLVAASLFLPVLSLADRAAG